MEIARRNGWNAHRKGKALADNPLNKIGYPVAHDWWNTGWRDRDGAAARGEITPEQDEEMEF